MVKDIKPDRRGLFSAIDALSEWKVAGFLILAVTSIYLSLSSMDRVPDIMEARNLVAARECVQDGNCLRTTINGQPRVRKPPLPTWAAALAMSRSGDANSVFAARLPSVVIVSLMSLFTYLLARHWLDKSSSLAASFVMVTSRIMMDVGRRATWDIFSYSFAVGGLWALFRALRREEPIVLSVVGSGILWGLSFLSKGPVTLYSVLLPFLLALFVMERRREFRWRVVPLILLLAIPLGASWWGYLYVVYPETLSILSSEVEAWQSRHIKEFYFYLFSFFGLIFPWIAPFIGASLLPFAKEKEGEPLISDEHKKRIVFFLVWLGITLLLLSIIPEKKERYTLPVLLPTSLAVAVFFERVQISGISELPRSLRVLWSIHLFQVLLLTFVGAIGIAYFTWTGEPISLLLFIPLLLATGFMVWKRRHSAGSVVMSSVLTIVILAVMAGWVFSNSSGGIRKFDFEGASRVATITAGRKLYTLTLNEKVTWGIRRTHEVIDRNTIVDSFPALVLVDEGDLGSFRQSLKSREISFEELHRFRFGKWHILYELNDEKSRALSLSKKDGS
ncbi:MAG: glycosyltransferase family 39 protein [Candidatus Tectomicrobia bacterium]|nr:glycosyltransferase family 39 protein [Candidatus Tectomicrobia bacterium]